MAGIGFQLKELYNQSSFFAQLRAYGFSAVTAVGPMFLSISLITFAREWLVHLNTPSSEVALFIASVQYVFVFSQILTGGFLFVLSRFLADQMFMEREENVLSSLYGAVGIVLLIGFVTAAIFYWSSPLPLLFKFISYLFFMELNIIWILSIYVSALKNYKKIVRSYLFGVSVSAMFIWGATELFEIKTATSVFIGLDIGFLLIAILLMRDVSVFFQLNNKQYFYFLTYLEKYPYLFFIGLFYYLGLYGHNFAVWFGNQKIFVADTFLMAPYYDTPVFYAYFSLLPALVLFMVTLETTFYTKYKKYYGRILNGFPLYEIENAKQEMYRTLRFEILFLAQVQLLVTFIFLFLGVHFLPYFGLIQDQINIYMVVVLGSWFLSLLITFFLILLYFDERKAAFSLTGFYAFSSFFLTILFSHYFDLHGAGMFIAAVLSFGYGSWLLIRQLNDIDYSTFCSQPIIYKEKTTLTERFLRKVGSLD
ncbi:putative membrane protein [Planomicrobium sp. HSC-17F08]|nr:putative membrane protein [Planomicrobium sp. HSC-17F08]